MYDIVTPSGEIHQITLGKLLEQSTYTLLYFYPKDNTPGCTTEAQDFSRLIAEFTKLEVQIVGVSKDSAKSHCGFIEKHGLKPSYLSDPDVILHKQFGARGMKKNYGKEYEGVIRSTFLLDATGDTLAEWCNVRAKGHAERVLKEIPSITS